MVRRRLFIGLASVAAALSAAWVVAPRQSVAESTRLFSTLKLQPGMTVADIGAGEGELAAAAAHYVGNRGHVYATEISPESRDAIGSLIEAEGLSNITVVESMTDRTNLQAGAVDAAFMRNVYHHLSDPDSFLADLYLAIKPGGRVAIVDRPMKWWYFGKNEPHGVSREKVEADLAAAGFLLDERIEPWVNSELDPLRNALLGYYCLIFRKNRL